MADATYDFDNLIITLPAQSQVDLGREVYSAWKRAMKANDQPETGVYQAWGTSGGEPLTPGVTAGSYYFLRNDIGWRIKPPEQDIDINLVGNLAPTDTSLPVTIPTTGAFTALITNLQPITQNVEELLSEQEKAAYNGFVVVDQAGGTPGTSYPAGLFEMPVDNLTDAKTILAAVGGRGIVVEGNLTLDQDMDGYRFRGEISERLNKVSLNNFSVDNSSFEGVTISGTGSGKIGAERCILESMEGLTGTFRQCGFVDSVSVLTSDPIVFAFCHSEVAGSGKPLISCNGVAVDISFRAYSGGLDVANYSQAGSVMTIDLISGAPRLNASCTAGEIVVRGVGNLTDNSAGTTVIKDGLVDGLDVKLIKALEAGNVTIVGDNPYVIDVLDPDDNVTVIARFEVSNDGLTRTRTL